MAPPTAATPAPPPDARARDVGAPPRPGMVWVNLETKVFHRAGDRWYGRTKRGEYLTEADALKGGYRESRAHESEKPLVWVNPDSHVFPPPGGRGTPRPPMASSWRGKGGPPPAFRGPRAPPKEWGRPRGGGGGAGGGL